MLPRASRRQIPFRDDGGVADAEQSQLAVPGGIVILRPGEALDLAVCAALQGGLVVPGAGERVPDLNGAVGAAKGEAEGFWGGARGIGSGGVREGEGGDFARWKVDEATAVEGEVRHCCVLGGLSTLRGVLVGVE